MDFLELKKNLKRDFSGLKTVRLALLGDFATQHLSIALRGYARSVGIDLLIFEADYDQIDHQVLQPRSELHGANIDFVLVFFSAQKFQRELYDSAIATRRSFSERKIKYVQQLVAALKTKSSSIRIIISNLMELDDNVFGQYANHVEASFLFQIRKLNYLIMESIAQEQSVFVLDVAATSALVGHTTAVDNRNYFDSEMAFSLDFLPILAKSTLDIIVTVTGSGRKCLILDLDNTLWGGVIGDDGFDKIQLGHLGIGKAFTELQYWARELRRRGILLAICSKNDDKIARTPFIEHPDMVLGLDDIAIFLANWDSKVDNIKAIQQFLNIGFDAMVFLDDSPYERGVVRQHLPSLTVPELPEDPCDYLPYLRALNLFETTSFTTDDGNRTAFFQEERERDRAHDVFTDERDFLRSLGMKCEIGPITSFNLPRAVQLLARSNQFNLRTIRHSEENLKIIAASVDYLTWTFTVSDRFGDYGLVCLIIGRIDDIAGEQGLFIESWVMSCRVLKRGVEELALNEIVQSCSKLGIARIRGEYIPTAKNELVRDHYRKLGFIPATEGLWILDVASYTDLDHLFSRDLN
jgi:FkbH-like protein